MVFAPILTKKEGIFRTLRLVFHGGDQEVRERVDLEPATRILRGTVHGAIFILRASQKMFTMYYH